MTGYAQTELISMPIGTLTHPDDSVAVKQALRKTSVKDVLSHSGDTGSSVKMVGKNGFILLQISTLTLKDCLKMYWWNVSTLLEGKRQKPG